VDADLVLVEVGQSTSTNERGEYIFKGLPPGSYRLQVRKIGYAEREISIDVEGGDHRARDIVMHRVTTLDSVSITAKSLPREEGLRAFEEHRKMGLGKFLSLEELEKLNSEVRLSTLMRQWPGLRIPTSPVDTWPISARGVKSFGRGCAVTVYLDGVRLDPAHDRDLDHIAPPSTLAGVEWYPGAATVPPEYARLNANCGVLVLHSRYKAGKPPEP
jgi:hypothetical protein